MYVKRRSWYGYRRPSLYRRKRTFYRRKPVYKRRRLTKASYRSRRRPYGYRRKSAHSRWLRNDMKIHKTKWTTVTSQVGLTTDGNLALTFSCDFGLIAQWANSRMGVAGYAMYKHIYDQVRIDKIVMEIMPDQPGTVDLNNSSYHSPNAFRCVVDHFYDHNAESRTPDTMDDFRLIPHLKHHVFHNLRSTKRITLYPKWMDPIVAAPVVPFAKVDTTGKNVWWDMDAFALTNTTPGPSMNAQQIHYFGGAIEGRPNKVRLTYTIHASYRGLRQGIQYHVPSKDESFEHVDM